MTKRSIFVNNICRIRHLCPIKKIAALYQKNAAFYRIILKNFRILTALFWKLPHVYHMFSFLKDMRHHIILKKNTAFKQRLCPVGRQLPSGKRASQWEGSILLDHWDGHFPMRRKFSVGRKLFTGKRASQWTGSFSARNEPPIGKRLTEGRELPSIKEVSQYGK